MAKVALTTLDNPYHPITQFDEWYAYDMAQGYGTCAYLARVAKSSDDLSEVEQDEANEAAINEIVSLNLLGNYIKVTEQTVIKGEQTSNVVS